MEIIVQKPGFLTTVQDSGRWGFQHLGVPVAGPMDWASHQLANQLVGNDGCAAALEVTMAGPTLRFDDSAVVAVTGAEFALQVDGENVPTHASCFIRRGQTLGFGPRVRGVRAYVAVGGGIAVAPVLGSCATHVVSGMGGLAGRPLRAGDRLATGEVPRTAYVGRSVAPVTGLPGDGARVRVLAGPHVDRFERGEIAQFEATRFRIATEADRMGYRLEGRPISVRDGGTLISRAVVRGMVQVPPDGRPIVLMADSQTAGGYPGLATVITADLPIVGQLSVGQWLEFACCTPAEARAALKALESRVMAW